jgi:hypothetical protein
MVLINIIIAIEGEEKIRRIGIDVDSDVSDSYLIDPYCFR